MLTAASVCAQLKFLNVFPLLSHPWAAIPPPLLLKSTPYFPYNVCGPGGAGACCPEDRGSAGSQKHLSVPPPLHCNPPGTALSPAPAVRKFVCRRKDASWMSDYGKAGAHDCSVRAWVCLSLPIPSLKHTILSVTVNSWPYQHGGCTTTSAVLPPLQSPHMKSLTWLNASSSHPD